MSAQKFAFSALMALATASPLFSRAPLIPRELAGQATYYGGNVAGGACSFSTYTLPSGIFGTALSDSNWDTSANCGACVSVTGPSGNAITAMIVDECPGCGTNHLDLFPDAFTELAAASTGVISVSWDYIDCPITTPLQLHNKEGVSAYWFSMQVVNAAQTVESLEVSTDGGSTWQSTTRMTYNFFENSSGFGTTTVDVKVTSTDGSVVIVNDVDVSSGASVTASSNFGTSSSASSSVAASSTQAESSSATVATVAASSAQAASSSTTVIASSSTQAASSYVVAESSSSASVVFESSSSSSSYTAAATETPTTAAAIATTTSASSTSETSVYATPSATYSSSSVASIVIETPATTSAPSIAQSAGTVSESFFSTQTVISGSIESEIFWVETTVYVTATAV